MDTRQQLIGIILEKSYREGDFTLASGKKSSFYIDLKATTLSADGASCVGLEICSLLEREGWLKDVAAVGGLTLGADPIATAVSVRSLDPPFNRHHPRGVPAFIVRKEAKGHGTSKVIEGLDHVPSHAKLVVVEDVSTTGGSAWQAVEKVMDAGFEVLGVVTVVDREQGASEFFASKGIPFRSVFKISEIKSRYRA